MQGRQEFQPKLFSVVDFESLIPQSHTLRKMDRILDFSFVRELTHDLYCQNNGRPSVDPELFFRMVLIAHLYAIPSDRQLCEEVQYNLAYRWFCRLSLEDAVPDHSSMTRIRDRMGEKIFAAVFDRVLDLCRAKGLLKGERIMTDGSFIKADASLTSMVKRDGVEPPSAPAQSPDSKLMRNPEPKALSNKTHVSKSDPDSTLAKIGGHTTQLTYKLHQSIDADSSVIIDCHVTTGSVHDSNVYLERVDHLRETYPIKEAIADRAYGSAEILQNLEAKNIETFIPLFSSKSGSAAPDEESGFVYDREKNIYRCPEGKELTANKTFEYDRATYQARSKDCLSCPRQKSCLPKTKSGTPRPKRVRRSLHQDFYDQVREKMGATGFRMKLRERMWKIEGLFAEAKNQHGLGRARYRGRSKMQIQAYSVAILQNLKRLVQVVSSGTGDFSPFIFFRIQFTFV